MSTLYIKILSDYYHHIISDLDSERKKFLKNFYEYLLEKDEYGYEPIFENDLERITFLLKEIYNENVGMSLDEFFKLMKWYEEDGWSNGEIFEYFLYHKKTNEIKLIFDIHSLSENEIIHLKDLEYFLKSKNKKIYFFNPHNGKYQNLKEILIDI